MDEGGVAVVDPEARGSLSLTAQAVERLAVQIASEVDGVAQVGSALDRLVGPRYPHAAATIAGLRVRVSVEIAVAWPHPLAEVTARVRSAVRVQLHQLAGLQVDAVDVTAARVVRAEEPRPRRVQ